MRHLFDPSSGQWLDPCIFQRHFRGLRPPSLRLIEHEFRLLRSALSQCFPTLFLEKGCHLPDSVALQTVPLFPSSLVNFVLPSFENGLIATSKIAYRIFNIELNNLSSTLFSHWHDIGYLEPSTKLNWNLIYQLPTSKKEGDTQFRLLHNITAARCSSSFQLGYFFVVWMVWGKKEQFNISSSNAQLFNPRSIMIYWILFFPPFNLHSICIGLSFRTPEGVAGRLSASRIFSSSAANTLFIICIVQLFSDPLIVWVHRLKSRILFEFHYYKLCHNPYTFFRKWSVNDTLFVLKEEALSWLI